MSKADLLSAAKELLARIEDGSVTGFACITLESDDTVGQSIAGSVKDDKFKAIAALTILQRDILDGVDRLKDRYPAEFRKDVRGDAKT